MSAKLSVCKNTCFWFCPTDTITLRTPPPRYDQKKRILSWKKKEWISFFFVANFVKIPRENRFFTKKWAETKFFTKCLHVMQKLLLLLAGFLVYKVKVVWGPKFHLSNSNMLRNKFHKYFPCFQKKKTGFFFCQCPLIFWLAQIETKNRLFLVIFKDSWEVGEQKKLQSFILQTFFVCCTVTYGSPKMQKNKSFETLGEQVNSNKV